MNDVSFQDDFEGATIVPPWDAIVTVNGTVDLSTANPKFGTKHLRCQILGTIVSRACVSKTFAVAQQKYVRLYFDHVSGAFDLAKRLSLVALYPDVPGYYYCVITIVDGKLQVQYRHAAGTEIIVSDAPLTAGHHELELGVKIGNGTGEVHALLDNVALFDVTDLINNEWAGITSAKVGIVFADGFSAAHVVDIDQVAIADAPIGPYVPGAPPECPICPTCPIIGLFGWTFPMLTWLRNIIKQQPAYQRAAYRSGDEAVA